jgi:hypothetical protein
MGLCVDDLSLHCLLHMPGVKTAEADKIVTEVGSQADLRALQDCAERHVT